MHIELRYPQIAAVLGAVLATTAAPAQETDIRGPDPVVRPAAEASAALADSKTENEPVPSGPEAPAPAAPSASDPSKAAAPASSTPEKKKKKPTTRDFLSLLGLDESALKGKEQYSNPPPPPPPEALEATGASMPAQTDPVPEAPLPEPGPPVPDAANILPDEGLMPDPPLAGAGEPIPGSNPAPAVLPPGDTEEARAARAGEAASKFAEVKSEYSGRRISLADAVRLALANNPDVGLAVQDANGAAATLQQIRGAFDTSLHIQVDYSRRNKELKDKEKEKERARYAAIKELYETATIMLDRIDEVRRGERNPRDFSFEGTALEDPNSTINVKDDPDDQAVQELEFQRDLKLDALLNLIAGGDNQEVDKLARQAVLIQEKIFRRLQRQSARNLIEQPPWIVNRTETHQYEVDILKKMRGGPDFKLYAKMTGQESNVATRSKDPRENRTAIGAQVTVNLMKLGSADPDTAQEMAGEERLKAQQESARAKVTTLVLETVQAYWRLAAAQERLGHLIRSELENVAVESQVQRMVELNKMAPRDGSRLQAQAQATNAVANRYSAEIELATAQQALAVFMGLDPERVYVAPLAADSLPELVDESSVKAVDFKRLVDHTMARHADLSAFRHLGNAHRILIEQARGDLRPDLEVFAAGEFTGYNQQTGWDGYFGSWGSNHTGTSVILGGKFDWPIENNARKGALTEAHIEATKNDLLADTARRKLATDVALSLRKIVISSRQSERYAAARSYYEEALAAEREKLRSGKATVLDVLQTEQSLTQARLTEISSRLEQALSLAKLRHATFTILPPFSFDNVVDGWSRTSLRFTSDYFTSLPSNSLLNAVPVSQDTYVPKKNLPLLDRLTGSTPGKDGVVLPPGSPAPRSAPPPAGVQAVTVTPAVEAPRNVAPATPPPAPAPAPKKSRPLLQRIFGD